MLLQQAAAQASGCTFKAPFFTIHFGTGDAVNEINTRELPTYTRVATSCPSDGYYSYTSYTSECFRGDWFTLPEDHTPGDRNGNIMLVNASYEGGVFFNTSIDHLKSSTTYEFGVWMMNVCEISDKCPFPLLPNITIRLKTPSGKTVAQFATGSLPRREAPHWTQYRAVFTMPAAETTLLVTMEDMTLGGCGNDFALDDITIRECVKPNPVVQQKTAAPRTKAPTTPKPVAKKEVPKPAPATTTDRVKQIETVEKATPIQTNAAPKEKKMVMPPPPAVLLARSNPLIKQIETKAGEIKIDLYDNGEIDGDTVSIYHNNELLISRARLSQKAISFHISVDAGHPHHELIMVANNLGSIPPNTSLMIVTAGENRFQVFLSSTEQKNAKVVFDLKE